MIRTNNRRSVLALAAVAFAVSFGAASAYSPESGRERAQAMCQTQGFAPGSSAWELCVSHVSRAFEWGEFGLAKQMAREARRADANCAHLGARPETPRYVACVNREVERHSHLQILGDDQSGVNVAMSQ
jgi:hypothetical protein